MTDSPETKPVPGSEIEEIPVEELIRMTREFTRRINNQDRRRLGVDLRESGHTRSLTISAPITLQQFFSGEIDLDTDLARRFLNAPLLSNVRFLRAGRQPDRRQETAIFSTNDDSFFLTVDSHQDANQNVTLEFSFTMVSALAMRFRLSPLTHSDRSRWLDLMGRSSGIAFLWTRERWEEPYLIFVVREHFARLYAFSPTGIEAAARMTPNMITSLMEWLEGMWFPDRRAPETDERVMEIEDTLSETPGWDVPALAPERSQLTLRALIPNAPEEQWDDQAEPAAESGGADESGDNGGDAGPTIDESDLSADDLSW